MGEFFVGLDLGQARDRTAVVVMERVEYFPPVPPPPSFPRRRGAYLLEPPRRSAPPPPPPPPLPERHYHVRHGERLRPGTPYPAVVERVRSILDVLVGERCLLVDATGVGRPVVDLFEAARIYPLAITLTAGESAVQEGSRYRVPKRDLVTAVEVLLQEHRLKIGRDVRDREALVDELLSFRASVSAAGRDSYAAEGSGHDDLVIALALACWRGLDTESQPPRLPTIGISEQYQDRDEADARWIGDPDNRYRHGYEGRGSRFIPGCRGISGPTYMPFRFR